MNLMTIGTERDDHRRKEKMGEKTEEGKGEEKDE
jgi:hypothetical protein